jgi:hypothetical protein
LDAELREQSEASANRKLLVKWSLLRCSNLKKKGRKKCSFERRGGELKGVKGEQHLRGCQKGLKS